MTRDRVRGVRRAILPILLLASCAGPAAPSTTAAQLASAAPAAKAPEASSQPLSLAPGEVVELGVRADGSAAAALQTPSGNERFILVIASTRFDAERTPVTYALELGAHAEPSISTGVAGCSLDASSWAYSPVSVDAPPTGEGPALGTKRFLDITGPDGTSAIESEVISVGEHATVIRDLTHPTTLDGAFAEQFRTDFEDVILPRARQVFGTESDIDGNGRIQLVFSRLTRERGVAFFSACDLMATLEGCPSSNRGEYLYLTPPDAIAPPYNTPNAIKEILTHELGHLLHFNRKVLRNHLTAWTDTIYASEGIGALAQDVVGYQAGNLYVAKAGLDGIDAFSLSDIITPRRPEGRADGMLRGAAYLFFRWLYDRAGGDEVLGNEVKSHGGPAFLRALLDAPEPVMVALPRVARAKISGLALDFYTALAVSNREESGLAAAQNACFRYLPVARDPLTGKQRGASLFAAFHGTRMTGPRLTSASATDQSLRPGGVEYVSLDAAPGQLRTSFSLSVDPSAAPRVRLARLQ
jgi:hypothetical protein